MNDDFWTHDISLFDGSFKYYRNRKQPVRGKLHVASEKYFDVYGSLERDYMKTTKGERSYVMMQPYVIESRIVLSVALHPKPKQFADQREEIGRTTGSRTEGYRDTQIGNAQAWYYPEDLVLVLWECFLDSFIRDGKLTDDKHMTLLWRSFEQWLLTHYADAQRIVTPWADPLWQQDEYQKFLKVLGFRKGKPGMFAKLLK